MRSKTKRKQNERNKVRKKNNMITRNDKKLT